MMRSMALSFLVASTVAVTACGPSLSPASAPRDVLSTGFSFDARTGDIQMDDDVGDVRAGEIPIEFGLGFMGFGLMLFAFGVTM